MQEKKFLHLIEQYPNAIRHYCSALEWDYDKFRTSISDEGISHTELYLENPNEGIIDKLSQFLEPTNQSSVFIIWDEVGMGKSSIRDFVSKSLEGVERYHTILITDPRLTSLQILRLIAHQVGLEITARDRGRVKEALRKKLIEIADKGVSLVVWVDEAEKINKYIISELRALSDLKTEKGAKACKLILSGTPALMQKIESYIETDPEDAAAFDDRASIYTFKLNRWKTRDIFNYWRLLSEYCGKTNPFTLDAAETVYKISEGKPRTIAQLTRLVINLKAMQYFTQSGSLEITSEDILSALKGHLGEESA